MVSKDTITDLKDAVTDLEEEPRRIAASKA
jgi:hypothetical protein